MRLTCPECATTYNANADSIGEKGRTVRCSKCDTTWFVSADPDVMGLQDQEVEEQRFRETPAEERFDHDNARFANEPAMGAHVQIRDMADQKRRSRRLMGISLVWMITLTALIFAALLAYSFRQSIVERYPAAASIYQAFGISVKSLGLDFESPKTRNVVLDGQPTLVVNGFVRNKTAEPREVPMIELSVVNADGDKLAIWAVEPAQQILEPGGRLEYVSEYPNPPLDAASLKYRFLEEGEDLPEPIIQETDELPELEE